MPPPTQEEQLNIEEMRKRFEALPLITSPEGTPGSEAEWNDNMNRLRELVLSENPREFLRWEVIRYTMFSNDDPYLHAELKYLKSHSLWKSLWKEVIPEETTGHPIPYYRYPNSSGNLIHHTYHTAQFQDQTDIELKKLDLVLEFGGGYGSFCRVIHKLGFHGKYIIFDLPHFSELQRYFLRSIGISTITVDEFHSADNGVCCVSDFQQLATLLSSIPEHAEKLFTATWSLSETPVHIREKILPLVTKFDAFLIAYQHRFNEMDNSDFFTQWRTLKMQGLIWKDLLIPQIPDSSYLFGRRL